MATVTVDLDEIATKKIQDLTKENVSLRRKVEKLESQVRLLKQNEKEVAAALDLIRDFAYELPSHDGWSC